MRFIADPTIRDPEPVRLDYQANGTTRSQWIA